AGLFAKSSNFIMLRIWAKLIPAFPDIFKKIWFTLFCIARAEASRPLFDPKTVNGKAKERYNDGYSGHPRQSPA
ncbi:MAG: hypothetical protein MUO52_06600, partial [Desulfobacterales bacterium]|nr:hypothetical protein [Desulfobacterales bacterium]